MNDKVFETGTLTRKKNSNLFDTGIDNFFFNLRQQTVIYIVTRLYALVTIVMFVVKYVIKNDFRT